jgi:glycine dehydrogenase subunit 2
MAMNTQGRPTGTGTSGYASTSGSSLLPNEPLLFEIGDNEHSGVDLPDATITDEYLGGFRRKSPLDLAGLTEPEAMRHYVRLSRLNYSIDSGMYPLGSCTMKHNPRLNEKMARLPGFADIHPLQPLSTVQGALQLPIELVELGFASDDRRGGHSGPPGPPHGVYRVQSREVRIQLVKYR